MNISEENFESIKFKNDIDIKTILCAMEEVRKFIIKKKLILYGGMAMDQALRTRGSSIYGDEEVPDYDFFSPNHHTDAYDLAELLIEKGYEEVQVVGAIHTTTMRVRVSWQWVADIGYCPKNVFDSLNTLEYKGLLVVHPYYSVIDQCSSLCRPFDEPPREVIFHRWKKDNTRMKKILDVFPLEASSFDAVHDCKLGNSKKWFKKYSSKDYIILGWPALLYYTKDIKNPLIIPEEKPYIMVNSDFEIKNIVKEYNSMMDYPRVVETKDCFFMVADGIQYNVNQFKTTTIGGGGGGLSFQTSENNIASIPMLYWFFMFRWMFYNDQWAYDGLLKLREIENPEVTIDHIWGTESVSKAQRFTNLKFVNPGGARGLKPNNQYFKNDSKKVSTEDRAWSPNDSRWFSIDGQLIK